MDGWILGRPPRAPLAGAIALLLAVVLAACAGPDDSALLRASGSPPAGPDAAPAVGGAPPAAVPDAPALTTTPVPTTATTSTAPPTTATTAPAAPPADGLAPPLARPWADRFVVAHAEHSPITVRESPDGPELRALADPTPEGLPLVFFVRGASEDGRWLHIQLPGRPNGSMGWALRADVTLSQVSRHVLVSRSTNRVTVFEGERPLLELAVSVGAPSSPTPLGTFYVDGLHQVIGDQDGVYGPFQISFTGYSTVYETFAGGIGQVAFHGTNRPELIGRPASNGCVRLSNADIVRLSRLVPIGTPVEVVA